MSVAFLYNFDELKAYIMDFIQYQIDIVKESIHQADERIAKLEAKINSIKSIPDEKTRIELGYAQQDTERAKEYRNKLIVKYDLLEQQFARELCKS